MHAILDVAEVVLTENMDSKQLDAHNRKYYHAPLVRAVGSGKPEDRPDPAGFEVEDQQDSFSAFQKFAGGLE